MDENLDPLRPAPPPTLPYARPPTSHDLVEAIICFVFGAGLGAAAVFMLIAELMALRQVLLNGTRRELLLVLPVLLFMLIAGFCSYNCVRCIRAGYRLWRR